MFMRRRINHDLAKLDEAKRRQDSCAIQKGYEDLFALCREHHIDLTAVLRDWEMQHSSHAA